MSKRAERVKEALRDRFIEDINRLWPQAMGRVMKAENKLTPAEEQYVLMTMAGYAEAYFFGAHRACQENLRAEVEIEKVAKAAKRAKKAEQLRAKKAYKGGE